MNDAPPPPRMTAAELDAAAARMFPPANDLAPMPAADVLASIVWSIRGSLLDLWTLRDSMEADARRATAALTLPSIAAHLAAATDELEALAGHLRVTLPPESPLFDT